MLTQEDYWRIKELYNQGISYQSPLQGPFFFTDEISLNRDSER